MCLQYRGRLLIISASSVGSNEHLLVYCALLVSDENNSNFFLSLRIGLKPLWAAPYRSDTTSFTQTLHSMTLPWVRVGKRDMHTRQLRDHNMRNFYLHRIIDLYNSQVNRTHIYFKWTQHNGIALLWSLAFPDAKRMLHKITVMMLTRT
jgi:hypothetical protein